MAKNPFRALCLPILTALCLAACQPLFNPQPTADPALAATQTAQRALLERIAATLTPSPASARRPGPRRPRCPAALHAPARPCRLRAGGRHRRGRYGPGVRSGREFIMGSTKYDRDLETNEVPQRTVYLDAFWISQTQVTNAMFARCVSAGACQYSASDKTNPRYQDPAYADHPVV
jgi:formylglycine-generating enzyme required for sulfatase activity